MSQPQKYEKTTTFANLKNVTQAFPQIDKELNNVASSINQIRDNLKVIQRDDGDVIITKNIEDALMQMAQDGVDTFGASIKATADNANSTSNNAVVIANNAYQKADSAEIIANNAVTTANESASVVLDTVTSISQTQLEVDTAIANLPSDISGEVSAQTANLPTLINEAVEAAVVEKSGVTEQTITTALGYKPATPASVTSEAEARQTSDNALQESITAEATARQALDNSLKTVAKTGDYSDLTGKPTYATVATTGSYNDLTNKPTIPVVPSNVSAFNNDAGYLTQHQSLADYATKSQLSGYLSRSGGTMTAPIAFASTQTFPSDPTKADASTVENKADKDFANVTKPYIVEMGENASGWWKILSNGWVEQGGSINTSTTGGYPNHTIPLPVEMRDNSFNVQLTSKYNNESTYGTDYCSGKTTVSISVVSIAHGPDWEVKGWKK